MQGAGRVDIQLEENSVCVILTLCLGSFSNELSTPEKHLDAALL